MTADAMSGVRDKVIDVGMNDYVTKPINPGELFRALIKWIKPGQRDLPEEYARGLPEADTSPEAELPADLPGIDISLGLSHVGGNLKLYKDILEKFVRDFNDSPEKIREALDQSDNSLAQRLAHTVKGVAGNIGAENLQESALVIESKIQEKQFEMIDEQIQHLSEALGEVLKGLEQIAYSEQEDGSGDDSERPKGDMGQLGSFLSELLPLAQKRQAKPAKKLMEQIVTFVWDLSIEKEIDNLKKLIQRYKFKDAVPIIESLEKKIQSSVK